MQRGSEDMLRFFALILKNVVRSRLRTLLTASAVMVLSAVCVVQQSVMAMVRDMIESEGSQTKLLVSEQWLIPSWIPVRYVRELGQIEEVEESAAWRLYQGYLEDSGRDARMALGIATNIDNLRSMTEQLADLDPAAIDALRREKRGVLLGPALMESLNWKIGKEFTCRSVSHLGKDLEFKVVGELPPGLFASNFFFRDDYYTSGTGDETNVSYVWLRTRSADAAGRVARRVRETFRGRTPEVKVETESAGVARFANRNQLLFGIINLVSVVLVLDMVLILSNSISLKVRERRREFAVLRAMGFQTRHILGLVVGEAACIGALSGFLGAVLAWIFFYVGRQGYISPEMTAITAMLSVGPEIALVAIVVGFAVGVLASVIPAWTARNVSVISVLSNVA